MFVQSDCFLRSAAKRLGDIANYACIQRFIYHLSPTGVAGFVMANGPL